MGRFNVVKELMETALSLAGIRLQAWMAPAFLLLVGVLLFPTIRRTHRVSQARKRLRKVPYANHEDRQRLEDQAMALVRGNPTGLAVVAQEALRLGRRQLARRAADALRETGRRQADLRTIELALEPPPAHSALDAISAIERLLAEGLNEEARRRRDLAKRRWPQQRAWPPIPDPDPKRSPASLDSHQDDRRAVGTITDDTPTTTRAPATTPTSDIPFSDSIPDPDTQ